MSLAAPDRPQRRTAPVATLVKVLGSVAGVLVTALLLYELGPRALADAMAPALSTLPFCFAIEAARIGLETAATAHALGPWAKRVPPLRLYAIHVATTAVAQIVPMPRPAAEATKASLLAPYGVPVTAAASSGATLQAATFLSVATMSLVCAAFVRDGAGVPLRAVLFANAALLGVLGVGIRALVRSEGVARATAERFPRLAGGIAEMREESLRGALVPVWPSLLLFVSMSLAVVEIAIVGRAMGVRGGASSAFAAFGAQLVAATVAVAVPGQLGAREASFSMAAGALGTTKVLAAGISTFTHGVQLVVALVGFGVLLASRAGRQTPSPT
ncbi:MAG: flippase-like domain-containing protein [Myxococcales bacterium]|nr:flippase-like domain-containing protein [Myxococcales bacterium]